MSSLQLWVNVGFQVLLRVDDHGNLTINFDPLAKAFKPEMVGDIWGLCLAQMLYVVL